MGKAMMQSLLMGGLVVANGCAAGLPSPAERDARNYAEFERHAGAPVQEFHFWQMDRWQSLGKEAIAVWTNPNEAYLIRVRQPCAGLDFANGVGVTSTGRRVNKNFDYVTFEHQRCQIAEIRPVDVKGLKAERRARQDD